MRSCGVSQFESWGGDVAFRVHQPCFWTLGGSQIGYHRIRGEGGGESAEDGQGGGEQVAGGHG